MGVKRSTNPLGRKEEGCEVYGRGSAKARAEWRMGTKRRRRGKSKRVKDDGKYRGRREGEDKETAALGWGTTISETPFMSAGSSVADGEGRGSCQELCRCSAARRTKPRPGDLVIMVAQVFMGVAAGVKTIGLSLLRVWAYTV